MTLASDTPLARLRNGTRQQHQHLERHALLQCLLGPAVTERQYTSLLQVFFSYFNGFEQELKSAIGECLDAFPQSDYQYRPRKPLLQKDLDDLGVAPLSETTARLPSLKLDSQAATLGTLYVLEGATQGGRVIAPRLAQSLGLGAHRGARYFNLYAVDNGWAELIKILAQSQPAVEWDAAVAAAQNTFACLQAYLNDSNSCQEK